MVLKVKDPTGIGNVEPGLYNGQAWFQDGDEGPELVITELLEHGTMTRTIPLHVYLDFDSLVDEEIERLKERNEALSAELEAAIAVNIRVTGQCPCCKGPLGDDAVKVHPRGTVCVACVGCVEMGVECVEDEDG
jgi:hypothetical protein